MSLSEQAITLQCLAHELMYLGTDGSPVYSDDLSRRNGEVYRLATALYASSQKVPIRKKRPTSALRS